MSQKITKFLKSLVRPAEPDYPVLMESVSEQGGEGSLRLTEKDFQNIVENLPVMYYAFDNKPPHRLFYLSSAFNSFGFSLEEWRSNQQLWIESIHAEDKKRVLRKIKDALRETAALDIEYRVIGKDGKTYWIRNKGCAVKNEQGDIICWQGIAIDITAQKDIEEELKRREQLYRTVSRNIPQTAVVVFDHDLRFTLAEGEELEKVGLSPEKIEGKTIFELFPPKITNELERYYRTALAGGFVSLEKEINGRTVRNYFLPLKDEKNEIYSGMSIWQDITDTKNKSEKIKENEERFREIFDSANDIIYCHDLKGNYLSINQAAEKKLGYSRNEISNLNMKAVIAPEHLSLASQMVEKKLKNKKARHTVYELDCITKSGQRITLEINSSLIFKQGKPVGVQGIARDITERKSAETRIQESEAELRALFAAMDDLIFVLDQEGRYLKITPTNPRLLDKTNEEILGKKVHDIFPKTEADYFVKGIKEVLDNQKSVRLEYQLKIKDKVHWFSASMSPMTENSVVLVAREISERKIFEVALRENEEKYRDLFENANDIIYTIDLQGNFTSLNRAGERLSGYTRKEAVSGKINISQLVAPEYLEMAQQSIAEKLSGKEQNTYELEIISKHGKRFFLEISTRLIYREGKPIGIQGIGRDISDRNKAERALKHSESQYRLLSEGIMHQVWTATPDGMLDYVNRRVLDYFAKKEEEILRESWTQVVHPDDLPGCLEKWNNCLKTGDLYETEFRLLRHDGEYRWHRAMATAGCNEEGNIVKWFGTNTDIHNQKVAEERLSYFAKHDHLTSLPNRAKFMSHLEKVVKRAEIDQNYRFAVLFLDLDRFKMINDSLGHLVGDKLLLAFSERLELCIRPQDIVARLGGDEFTILLNNLQETEDAVRVADRLLESLAKPFQIDEYEIFTSASIGIVISDKVKRKATDYLRDADTAMYQAKECGKSRYEIFTGKMHVHNLNFLKIESDLRKAIEGGEFRILYQPVISLESGEICEFESLIRWQHPENGLVKPEEFIRVAEETGLIIPIGNWLIEECCRQAAQWQKMSQQFRQFFVSVNLSAKQLLHPNLLTYLQQTLDKAKLKPGTLRLEVTESVVMENAEASLSILKSLKKLGISLSTDDFGTGHSSLSYLHRFPFDRLKIDRSFINKMDKDQKSEEIVRAIILLARNLELEVVAEGIETETQLRRLSELGCHMGQGYLFAKPLTVAGIEDFLQAGAGALRRRGWFPAMGLFEASDTQQIAHVQ